MIIFRFNAPELLALVVSIALPMTAHGQDKQVDRFITGNDLYSYCDESRGGTSKTNVPMCLGYISGVVDAINTWQVAAGERQIVCIPSTANLGQFKDVVLAYLRANPAKRHYGGSTLVLSALNEAFPCQQENS